MDGSTENGIFLSLDICDAAQNDGKRLESAIENTVFPHSESLSVKLLADKGYYGEPCRKIAEKKYYTFLTPKKINSKTKNSPLIDRILKKRSIIERVFARLYPFRRMDSIFDKTLYRFIRWYNIALGVISVAYF